MLCTHGVTPYQTSFINQLLKERSAIYARVLSLGFNGLARTEVTYPPIIDPGNTFGGVAIKYCTHRLHEGTIRTAARVITTL